MSINIIKPELDKIKKEAQQLVDYYWSEMKIYSNGEDFGYLGVRLRVRETGISIEWYNAFFNKHNKTIQKYYIKKGRGNSYKLDTIKKHKHRRDYEKRLIDELEPLFAQLRKRAKALSRVSLAIKRYNLIKYNRD